MNLQQFFPYRLARLAEAVSLATAQVYSARFELTRDEWRVMAALAEGGEVKTAALMDSCSLDKMRVSRALARMQRDGLVGRSSDPEDGRAYLVRLLPPGQAMYRKIVPMVLAREAFLLAELKPGERAVLDKALAQVLQRAQQLQRQG